MRSGTKVAIAGGVFAVVAGGVGYGAVNVWNGITGGQQTSTSETGAERRSGPVTDEEVDATAKGFLAAWAEGDPAKAAQFTNDPAGALSALAAHTTETHVTGLKATPGTPAGTKVPFTVSAVVSYDGVRVPWTYESELTVARAHHRAAARRVEALGAAPGAEERRVAEGHVLGGAADQGRGPRRRGAHRRGVPVARAGDRPAPQAVRRRGRRHPRRRTGGERRGRRRRPHPADPAEGQAGHGADDPRRGDAGGRGEAGEEVRRFVGGRDAAQHRGDTGGREQPRRRLQRRLHGHPGPRLDAEDRDGGHARWSAAR